VNRRAAAPSVVGVALFLLLALVTIPMLVVGGTSLLFAGGGANCGPDGTQTQQPGVSQQAANSIPADYLTWFRKVGFQYGIPWTILAGIGKVESDDGRTNLPGVTSNANAFGAAGPMQIGIEGAAGNQWGGAAVHAATVAVAGVATDENGDGVASVYEPSDAIAGAAKYLVAHGVQTNPTAAIFSYNHADWYVQEVLSWASTYATGGFTVSSVTPNNGAGLAAQAAAAQCTNTVLAGFVAPNATVAMAVSYAEDQLGKPYLWGGTGPDAFDCSGLVMMAYRAAGVNIARTSQAQWKTLPHVAANQVLPGDLVFFAGADGTPKSPGHVGLVVGKNTMIEAYAVGTPVRISTFGLPTSAPGLTKVVGFARPFGPVPATNNKTNKTTVTSKTSHKK
jgi:cell wall-associated NlpC family hydrolase